MAFGFNSWNDDDGYQIDGTYANPALLRKLNLMTTKVQGAAADRLGEASFSLGAGEVFAFSSVHPTAVAGLKNGQVKLRAIGNADSLPITVWVYGPSPSRDDFGMRVFGPTGVVYDSSWKVLNVVGEVTGLGSFSFPAGRTYALMQCQSYIQVTKGYTYAGAQPNLQLILFRNIVMGSGRISSQNVNVENKSMDRWAHVYPFGSGSIPAGWNNQTDNAVTTQFLVVDVTGH